MTTAAALSPEVLFSEHGALAQTFADFEFRPQQQAMARAVARTLTEGGRLLVEAGTGVGKSLGYLAPAVAWALDGKRRVVVSTYTRVLQNQLIRKDIPLLQQAIGNCFRAAPVFGQENYLCRRRLHATVAHGLFDTPVQAREIDELLEWAHNSTGLLLDYPRAIDALTLAKIARNSDSCRYDDCPYRSECCYFAAREEWFQAQVLIINHYLYFANTGASCRLLPEFEAVVFDEAHRLEDVAAGFFGVDVSSAGLERLLNQIHHRRHRRGLLSRVQASAALQEQIPKAIEHCRQSAQEFFALVRQQIPAGASRIRLRTGVEEYRLEDRLSQPLRQLAVLLRELAGEQDDEDLAAEVQALMKSVERQQAGLESILQAQDAASVYWIECSSPRRAEGEMSVHLRSARIDVSDLLRETVFDRAGPVILTSATMTVSRSFSFLINRLGAQEAQTLLLDSPFDYSRQVLLYVDPELPAPTENDAFAGAAARKIEEILQLTRGRALVLFTSYDLLERVRRLVSGRQLNCRLLVQGEASTYALLREFQQDIASVLFATQSFWEGIDVPGEALTCLIITRLPFEVPDDPRVEGIADSLREQGREPFREYQLPQAVLRFRQGFGRLIRHSKDYGVVCVLDSRLVRKQYGRVFLTSLPKGIPVVHESSLIAQFLQQAASAEP